MQNMRKDWRKPLSVATGLETRNAERPGATALPRRRRFDGSLFAPQPNGARKIGCAGSLAPLGVSTRPI
jgi:hypothetical protein